MAAQPTPNSNKTSPPNNNPGIEQATKQLNPPTSSNPGTTNNIGGTTPVPPQFNLTECSRYLSSRNTAEMEAMSSKEVPPSEKPELYKPPVPPVGWGTVKYTSMANGADFLTSLFAKIDQQQHHQHQHQQHHQHHHPHPQHPQQHQHQHQHHHQHQQHQHKPIQSSNHHPHHYPNHPQKQTHQH